MIKNFDMIVKHVITTIKMIQLVNKSKNESKLDDFSNISLNQLERFESIPMRESLPGSELANYESPRAK